MKISEGNKQDEDQKHKSRVAEKAYTQKSKRNRGRADPVYIIKRRQIFKLNIFDLIYIEKGTEKPLDFANKHFSCFAQFISPSKCSIGWERDREINNSILDERTQSRNQYENGIQRKLKQISESNVM